MIELSSVMLFILGAIAGVVCRRKFGWGAWEIYGVLTFGLFAVSFAWTSASMETGPDFPRRPHRTENGRLGMPLQLRQVIGRAQEVENTVSQTNEDKEVK